MRNKVILGSDSKMMSFLSRIFDLIILNILFVLCSLPVITIGSSLTALYSVTLKMVRNEESYIFRSFFKSFKENFRQTISIWIPTLLMGLFLYTDFRILKLPSASGLRFLYIPLIVLTIFLACVLLYSFAISAYFKCSIKQILKNVLFLCLKHKAYTLSMLAISFSIIIVFTIGTSKTVLLLINLFTLIGFSSLNLLYAFFFRKIFDLYE